MLQEDPRKFMISLIQQNRSVILFEGLAFVCIGILALLAPALFSLALEYILGFIALFGAGVLGARIFQAKELPNRSSNIMTMILYLALGSLLLFYPLSGILTINLLLACFFIFDGIFKMTSSMQLRPAPRWGWLFFSGFLSFVLALLILMAFPAGAAWILGILVGINLLCTGFVQLALLWALPKE